MPVVSVVLPVYNGERFVAAAIDSIARQTFEDFEVLVINDGSSDFSLEVIQRQTIDDARFRIISRPNKGLVATCNEGVAEARGKYIFRMDADDVCRPDRFARQVRYLEENPACVAVGSRMLLCDDELLPIVEMINSFTHTEIDAENLGGAGSAMCHPSVGMRKDALLSVGGYRREFEWAEDLDLFLRLAEIGKLANLREVLLYYRQHLDSVGYSKRELQTARTALAVRAARERRGLRKDDLANRAAPGHAADATALQGSTVKSAYRSTAEIHRKWAWLALIGGHPRTARKHAMKAFRLEPLSRENPKLLACALRGY